MVVNGHSFIITGSCGIGIGKTFTVCLSIIIPTGWLPLHYVFNDRSVRRSSSLRSNVASRRRYRRVGDARRGERTYDLRVRPSTRQRDNRARRRRDERRDSVENRSWEREILGDFMHYPNAFISVHNYDCALVPSGASMQGEETVIYYGEMWMKFYRSF